MFKLIGSIIIIFATSWAGMEMARRLSERPRQLRLFRNALQALEAEIMYGHTPLPEAAKKLSRQIPKPLSLFFSSFSKKLLVAESTVKKSWDDSLREVWKYTAFTKNDWEIVSQFGSNLGRHDKLSQQKQIQLTLTHLQREEEDAKDSQHRYEKMVKSLGVLFGLLIVILLL